MPPNFALMFLPPVAIAVAKPLALTVATAGFVESQAAKNESARRAYQILLSRDLPFQCQAILVRTASLPWHVERNG
jgi:hypothetical protein